MDTDPQTADPAATSPYGGSGRVDGPGLEMRGISKRYPGVQALAGVDFILRRGEIRGLLGHNGAGKSTLIKIATGVTTPTSGTVALAGRGVPLGSPSAMRRLGLRVVHQELSLVPSLSVADNIFLGQERTRGGVLISRSRQERLVEKTFASLDIVIDPRTPVERLSRADREMIEIARAVKESATVLLLDEPTAPLARGEIDRLFEVVRHAADAGTGVVLVTHHISEVFEVCDAVTVLRDGRSVLEAATSEVSMSEVIEAVSGSRSVAADVAPATRAGTARADDTAAPAARQTGPLLDVVGLSVAGKLARVDLQLRGGEILGLVGLRGSGRSTLLKALMGTVRCAVAEIRVDGRPYLPRDSAYAIRRGMFRLSEDRKGEGLLLEHPIALNMGLANLARYRRGPLFNRRRAREDARAYARDLSIRLHSVEQSAGSLSGGNQQKVLMARALNTGCRVLLLDEPTVGVDLGAAAEIVAMTRSYVAAGNGVIWASSDLTELARVCDRVLVLGEGTVLADIDNRHHQVTEVDLVRVLEGGHDGANSLPGPEDSVPSGRRAR